MRIHVLPSTIFVLIYLFRFHAATQATQPTSQVKAASAEEQEIISVLTARANACAVGDAQTWTTFVDSGFRDIEGNKTVTRKQVFEECQEAARVVPGHKIERLASGFHFQFAGNIALVDYLLEYREHFGELDLTETVRQVDTCEKRQGKWIVLLSVSATVIPDPPIAKVDPVHLQDFIGEYAWVGSPMVDTVTVKGEKLYIQGSWEDTPTELFAEGPDTFFDRGAGVSPMARVRFVRDKQGRVSGERVYSPADGRGYSAKKVR